jgi:aminoglycoside phosphotransferase (APT) family kinase protein
MGGSTPRLGPPPQRIEVAVEQVRLLVAEQFPQWADLPVRAVAHGGWDNRTFHLGDGLLARLPSAAEYALAVEKEQRWLPVLATQLPLPIPVPVAEGRPGADYPFSWSVYQWIDGQPARSDTIADAVRFANDLAAFLAALHAVRAADGPRPGTHNWFRGATVRTYEEQVQRALARLEGDADVDVDLAQEIWGTSLNASWDGVATWFHGDVAEDNLLLNGGDLAAVIDFGTCGVGDPACDMAIAWTLLTGDARQAFRERLSVDDATWARGRGWALWKTLVACAQTVGCADDEAASARRILREIFTEYSASNEVERRTGSREGRRRRGTVPQRLAPR